MSPFAADYQEQGVKPTPGRAHLAKRNYANAFVRSPGVDGTIKNELKRQMAKEDYESLDAKVQSDFEQRFDAYLLGRMDTKSQDGTVGTNNDPVWGYRNLSHLRHPEIRKYIMSKVDARAYFEQYLIFMKKFGPIGYDPRSGARWKAGLFEHYIYFKYVLEENALEENDYLKYYKILDERPDNLLNESSVFQREQGEGIAPVYNNGSGNAHAAYRNVIPDGSNEEGWWSRSHHQTTLKEARMANPASWAVHSYFNPSANYNQHVRRLQRQYQENAILDGTGTAMQEPTAPPATVSNNSSFKSLGSSSKGKGKVEPDESAQAQTKSDNVSTNRQGTRTPRTPRPPRSFSYTGSPRSAVLTGNGATAGPPPTIKVEESSDDGKKSQASTSTQKTKRSWNPFKWGKSDATSTKSQPQPKGILKTSPRSANTAPGQIGLGIPDQPAPAVSFDIDDNTGHLNPSSGPSSTPYQIPDKYKTKTGGLTLSKSKYNNDPNELAQIFINLGYTENDINAIKWDPRHIKPGGKGWKGRVIIAYNSLMLSQQQKN